MLDSLEPATTVDAFEPASGGLWFQKLRGATQVHHAAKSVKRQCIVPKDTIANFLAHWHGLRVHNSPPTFIGFALLQNFQLLTFKTRITVPGGSLAIGNGQNKALLC